MSDSRVVLQLGRHIISIFLPPDAIRETIGTVHDNEGVTFIFDSQSRKIVDCFRPDGYTEMQEYMLGNFAKEFITEALG